MISGKGGSATNEMAAQHAVQADRKKQRPLNFQLAIIGYNHDDNHCRNRERSNSSL